MIYYYINSSSINNNLLVLFIGVVRPAWKAAEVSSGQTVVLRSVSVAHFCLIPTPKEAVGVIRGYRMACGRLYTKAPLVSPPLYVRACMHHASVLLYGFPAHLCILPMISGMCPFGFIPSLVVSTFPSELCRCFSDIFLSSGPRTGLLVNTFIRVWINRAWLPILLVVS